MKEYVDKVRERFRQMIPSCVRLLGVAYHPTVPGQPLMNLFIFDMVHKDGRFFTANIGVDHREVLEKSPEYLESLLLDRTSSVAREVAELLCEPVEMVTRP